MHHLLPWVTKFDLVMHHSWLCIMSWLCLFVYRVACFFLVVLLLDGSWFHCDCDDSFDYVASTTLWTQSSSERDFRQDDYYLGYHYYLCFASCLNAIAMSRFLPLVYQASLYAVKQPLTLLHHPSKPLFGYVTALLSPFYSIASCRWSWRFLHGGQDFGSDITISLI